MPVNNTAVSIAGPIPMPNTRNFLKWVDTVQSARRRHCVFKRTTNTYYIDPVSGNDGSAGTSTATAWKTLDNVRTQLAANCTNTSFLFKRGTTLKDYTGLSVASANNHFGFYGPNASAGAAEISIFNVNLGTAVVTWTLAATGRYTTSMPASGTNNPSGSVKPAWIRKVSDPLNPFTYVDSTAKVEATPYSFYIDGSNLIHLNPGSDTPSATEYEANPYQASPPNCIYLGPGSDGSWVDGLKFSGWGCQSALGGSTSGITMSPDPDEVVYVSNCESYYNGRHAFSQLGSHANGGGIVMVENCIAGYCSPIAGYQTFNSYSDKGNNETHFIGCMERFSGLPCNASAATPTTLAAGGLSQGYVFFGHSGTTSAQTQLYINRGCRILDERASLSRATTSTESWLFNNGPSQQFVAGTETDVSSYRMFVIDWESPRTQVDAVNNSTQPTAVSRCVFINSRFYWRHNYGNAKWWLSPSAPLCLNCIFELDVMYATTNTQFFTQNSVLTGVSPRFLNCAFIVRGSPNSGYYSYLAGTASTGMRFGNCLFASWDNYAASGVQLRLGTSSDQSGSPSVQNDTSSLRYCATVGCLAANTGNDRGFNSGLSMVNLETNNTGFELIPYGVQPDSTVPGNVRQLAMRLHHGLDNGSPLVGAGSPNPFGDVLSTAGLCAAPEYDFYGNTRPPIPAIGPFDYINTNTGTGSVAGTMVGSMILGD